MRLTLTKSRLPWPPSVALGAAVAWIAIYLADLRLLNQPMHVILAPVLIALTLPFARLPRGRTALFIGALATCFMVQKAISPGLSVRALFEIIMLGYCVSLAPSRTPAGIRWLTYGVGGFLAVSCAFFLLTIWVPAARDLRSQIYYGNAELGDKVEESLGEEMIDSDHFQQGGLSIFLHSFGYQIAGGVTLFTCLALFGTSRARIGWGAAAVIGAAAMVLAGERSVLVAVGMSLIAMLIALRRIGYAIVLLLVAGAGVLAVNSQLFEFTETRQYNLVTRMQEEGDSIERLELQLWALGKLPQYPLGIYGAGDSYDMALARDHRSSRFAPHNGYITRTLFYGWPVGIIVVAVVVMLIRMAGSTVKLPPSSQGREIETPLLWATVAMLANALFHNPSFVTFDSPTMSLILLYVVAWQMRSGAQPAAAREPTAAQAQAARPQGAFIQPVANSGWGARLAPAARRIEGNAAPANPGIVRKPAPPRTNLSE